MANPTAARTAGRSGLPADLAHGAGARRDRRGESRTGRVFRDRTRELYGADLMKDTQDGGSLRANGASGSGSPEAEKTPAPPANGPRRRWDLSRRSCEKAAPGTRFPAKVGSRPQHWESPGSYWGKKDLSTGRESRRNKNGDCFCLFHFGNFVYYMQYNCCILLEYLIQYKNG